MKKIIKFYAGTSDAEITDKFITLLKEMGVFAQWGVTDKSGVIILEIVED